MSKGLVEMFSLSKVEAIYRKTAAVAGGDDEWLPRNALVPLTVHCGKRGMRDVRYCTKWRWLYEYARDSESFVCRTSLSTRVARRLVDALDVRQWVFVGDLDPHDLEPIRKLFTPAESR
jgi:hypothetical protein